MPVPGPNPDKQALTETFQGIQDFNNFNDYLEGWIKPAVLGDLETVLEGSRRYWHEKKLPPGHLGRGDFVMGTALFAVFDHLGSFITKNDREWINTSENISRVARYLPSTEDIFAIVANMGRNALVHVAWPQTFLYSSNLDLAFGLTLGANSNLTRHDNMFVTDWFPYGSTGPKQDVLKLVLNVHALRLQLHDWISHGNISSLVTTRAFKRVRNVARCAGDPREKAKLEYSWLKTAGENNKNRTVPPYCNWARMQEEIENLFAESDRLHAWDTFYMRVSRDYGGKAVPDAHAHQRKRTITGMVLPEIVGLDALPSTHTPP